MGQSQTDFLNRFMAAFEARFDPVKKTGGQVADNTAHLPHCSNLRRHGQSRPTECFELGDVRYDLPSYSVIAEFDSYAVDTHNLLKYWPYVCGQMSSIPSRPILFCHFSDWEIYGAYRDLWQGLAERIRHDPARRADFSARQFDHGVCDSDCICQSLDWLAQWLDKE